MWNYDQSSGRLLKDGQLIGTGYSGAGPGKNNPQMQHVHNVGPLPRGRYTIGKPFDSPTHGPLCLPLTPDPGNEMYGRSAFLCHGDKKGAPDTASQGCMVMPRSVREQIAASPDTSLDVTNEVKEDERFFAPGIGSPR